MFVDEPVATGDGGSANARATNPRIGNATAPTLATSDSTRAAIRLCHTGDAERPNLRRTKLPRTDDELTANPSPHVRARKRKSAKRPATPNSPPAESAAARQPGS